MQSLVTVNNNVSLSLVSVTIAPSTALAIFTIALVFLALYLPPLPFRSARHIDKSTALSKYQYYDNTVAHPTNDYRGRFASYFDYNNTWWYPYWSRNRAQDPIELRDHPPLTEGLPQPRATLALEDSRRRSGTGSRIVLRATRRTAAKPRTSESDRGKEDKHKDKRDSDAVRPPRSPGRLSARLRIGQSLATAFSLPFDPQRIPQERYRGGPERDGKLDGIRRWLQPSSLEAPRKR